MPTGGLSPATALIPSAGERQMIQDAQVFTQATPRPSIFSRKKGGGGNGSKDMGRTCFGGSPSRPSGGLPHQTLTRFDGGKRQKTRTT